MAAQAASGGTLESSLLRAGALTSELAEHVRAQGAATESGLLHVDLVREIPEALKPRRIEISTPKTIEGSKAS